MTGSPIPFAAVRSLLQQIGLELAFLDPAGPRAGAVSVALEVLLGQLADTCVAGPAEIRSAVDSARAWIRDLTAGDDVAAKSIAERFNEWHPWMEEAVTGWERGRPLPPTPSALAGPAATVGRPTVDLGALQEVAVLPEAADPEMVRLFCADAEELLRDIEQGVLVLETRPDDPDMLATVFRAFHTFKGNAAVMQLVVLQRLAHDVESLLDAARRGTRRLDRPAIDVILAAADVLGRFVAEMTRQIDGQDRGRPLAVPIPGVVAAVAAVLGSAGSTPGRAAPLPGAEALPSRTAPAGGGPRPAGPDAAPEPSEEQATAAAPAPISTVPVQPPAPPAPVRQAGAGNSVRVDTTKLDGLVDLVGELVIAQSMVVQETVGERPADEQLARSLGQLRRITAELQRTAMALRMMPIRATFQKMSRLVRDAAVQVGKEVALVLDGEETELDRNVIEEIADPLVHMIRNAVDHGIEPPDERLAAGKPATGTITLRAFHQGGFVVVQISDDGRGLDPARIRAKAVARGLVAADAHLDERDVLELIFAPGFSTAEQVTDLSGRGVGMDVARRNIERIRGTIAIDSAVGRGTTFTISMPLTLAIIEGLVVAVGGERFVIPTLAIRESFRPAAGAVRTVHGRGELVDVRGRLVPLLRLGRHLAVSDHVTDPARGIVVVVEAGQDCRCLLVDDLVGKQEVVIKSLGETFAGRSGFAGAAILGDGRVSLILDTPALVRLKEERAETAA